MPERRKVCSGLRFERRCCFFSAGPTLVHAQLIINRLRRACASPVAIREFPTDGNCLQGARLGCARTQRAFPCFVCFPCQSSGFLSCLGKFICFLFLEACQSKSLYFPFSLTSPQALFIFKLQSFHVSSFLFSRFIFVQSSFYL